MLFRDRREAGQRLSERLTRYKTASRLVVLALPRGGVPVGFEVASSLASPLDVFLVRKLGVPGHSELAMGAIADGGVEVLHEDLIRALGVPPDQVQQIAVRERMELERRDRLFRGGHPPRRVQGDTVILVDDGLATGSTMEAAVTALRNRDPAAIVVAVPVGARESCERVARLADSLICLEMPEPFDAVGLWYHEFDQTSDAEVVRLLALAGPAGPPADDA